MVIFTSGFVFVVVFNRCLALTVVAAHTTNIVAARPHQAVYYKGIVDNAIVTHRQSPGNPDSNITVSIGEDVAKSMRLINHLVDPGWVKIFVEPAEGYDELSGYDAEVSDAGIAEVAVLQGDFFARMFVLHFGPGEHISVDVTESHEFEMMIVEKEVGAILARVGQRGLEIGVPREYSGLEP